jgi:SAM-dependent methyltransferase
VQWRQADVAALPYGDGSFDVVLCQFGVMFFPDRVAAYREIRRVLRSGGTFLFNVWSKIEDNEFASVVTDALSTLYPEDPPKFLMRTPYGHGCPAEIEADLTAAGFETCVLNERLDVSRAASPDVPAIAFCQGTPLRNEIESLEPGGLERATEVATEALRARYGSGPVEGQISAVVVSAS